MKIKINSTKREAAEEVFELFCFKIENKNESVIGISINENNVGEISRGFTCYNDTPEIELIGQHDDVKFFGGVPEYEDWNDEVRNDVLIYIEETFFNDICYNELGEYISIEFNK